MCILNWKQWNISWSHRQKGNDSSSSRWNCLVVSYCSRATTVFTQVKQSTGDFRGKITQAWFLGILWKEQIKPYLIKPFLGQMIYVSLCHILYSRYTIVQKLSFYCHFPYHKHKMLSTLFKCNWIAWLTNFCICMVWGFNQIHFSMSTI